MLKNCLIIIFMLLTTAITNLFIKDNFYTDININSNEENIPITDTENNEILENKNIEINNENIEDQNTNNDIKQNNEVDNVSKDDILKEPEDDKSNKEETYDKDTVEGKCEPLKFIFSFVRPDFSSFEDCTNMGDKYLEIGYGYICDYFPDDCGDVYYMLTLYEPNSGIMHDYHDIPLKE